MFDQSWDEYRHDGEDAEAHQKGWIYCGSRPIGWAAPADMESVFASIPRPDDAGGTDAVEEGGAESGGLILHDIDAVHCKHCGRMLHIVTGGGSA